MEVKLQKAMDLAESNKRRIDKLEEHQEKQDKLLNTVALIAQKQESMEYSLGEIKNDIRQIKDKPGKRWDSIVEKILLAIITGLVAFVMYKLGLT